MKIIKIICILLAILFAIGISIPIETEKTGWGYILVKAVVVLILIATYGNLEMSVWKNKSTITKLAERVKELEGDSNEELLRIAEEESEAFHRPTSE